MLSVFLDGYVASLYFYFRKRKDLESLTVAILKITLRCCITKSNLLSKNNSLVCFYFNSCVKWKSNRIKINYDFSFSFLFHLRKIR